MRHVLGDLESSRFMATITPRSLACGTPPHSQNRKRALVHRLHSGLMLAVRMTLPHFSVSSAMCFPKSAGVPPRITPLNSWKRTLILGSARAALLSLLSLSIISVGVFLGAAMPIHALDSKPDSISPKAGTSGRTSERVAVVTARGRNAPDLMYSIDAGKLSNATCT